MVLDVLSGLKSLNPLKSSFTLDDAFDQLNRSFMFLLLCTFGVVITVRQYSGNIIACHGFTKFKESDFVNDFCWSQGLYTVAEAYDKLPNNVPYPGIIPRDIPCIPVYPVVCPDQRLIKPPERVYHLWYQWVPFYFFISAVAFYLPYLLYKIFGFSDIKPLLSLLHNPLASEDELEKVVSKATSWLYYRIRLRSGAQGLANHALDFLERHRLGLVVVVVKVGYLAISVLVFLLTDRMFTLGSFRTYGTDWVEDIERSRNASDYRTRARDRLFPKMVSCFIQRWGPSGLEHESGMCVLAPNVINQYLFLLLWFALLIIITSNSLSVALAMLKIPLVTVGYRRFLIRSFLKDTTPLRTTYYSIGTSGRIIFHLLANNVQNKILQQVITNISDRISAGSTHNQEDPEAPQDHQDHGRKGRSPYGSVYRTSNKSRGRHPSQNEAYNMTPH